MTAVYIRNVRPEKQELTERLLAQIEQKGIETCLFTHSNEAITHSKKIKLIVR